MLPWHLVSHSLSIKLHIAFRSGATLFSNALGFLCFIPCLIVSIYLKRYSFNPLISTANSFLISNLYWILSALYYVSSTVFRKLSAVSLQQLIFMHSYDLHRSGCDDTHFTPLQLSSVCGIWFLINHVLPDPKIKKHTCCIYCQFNFAIAIPSPVSLAWDIIQEQYSLYPSALDITLPTAY